MSLDCWIFFFFQLLKMHRNLIYRQNSSPIRWTHLVIVHIIDFLSSYDFDDRKETPCLVQLHRNTLFPFKRLVFPVWRWVSHAFARYLFKWHSFITSVFFFLFFFFKNINLNFIVWAHSCLFLIIYFHKNSSFRTEGYACILFHIWYVHWFGSFSWQSKNKMKICCS